MGFTHWSGTPTGPHVPGVKLTTDFGGLPVVWEDYSAGALTVTETPGVYGDRVARLETTDQAAQATVLAPAVSAAAEVAVTVVAAVTGLGDGEWLHLVRVKRTGGDEGHTVVVTADGRVELVSAWASQARTEPGSVAAGDVLHVRLSAGIGGGRSVVHVEVTRDGDELTVLSHTADVALDGETLDPPMIGKTLWESATTTRIDVHAVRVDTGPGVAAEAPPLEPAGDGVRWNRKGVGPVTLRGRDGARAAVHRKPHASIPDGVAGRWQLRVADDFDSLDDSTWTTLRGSKPWLYNDPHNSSLDDSAFRADRADVVAGALRLSWDPAPTQVGDGTVYPYAAGIAHTGNSSGWVFEPPVYIEARIMVPDMPGIWPAFWMLPTPVDDHWPPEIDIAEWIPDGNPDGLTHPKFNYHWDDGGPQQAGWEMYGTRGRTESGEWHTYGLLWQPGRVQAFIDRRPGPVVEGPHVTSAPMYLILSAGVRKGQTPPAGAMLVDWVRVWSPIG